MYSDFESLATDRSRRVMVIANQEAKDLNHEYIGTEHILLGLIKEGLGVGCHVLKNLGLELNKIREEIKNLVKCGPKTAIMGNLPQTPRAKKVIEYAIEEMRAFNHEHVGTEHLLLGLLREQDGVAAQVLMNLGLRLEDIRAELIILGANEIGTVPQSVLDVLNFSTFVAGDGLVTKNFPFSELREVRLGIGCWNVPVTPLLAAYLVAASRPLPLGQVLDEKTLLELMIKK